MSNGAGKVADWRWTGFGNIQPSNWKRRAEAILREGTRVERRYLKSRMKLGGGESATAAVETVRRRRLNSTGSAFSPSTIRDE